MKHSFLLSGVKKRGVTLLMAVLITSIVLAVGFGIYQRTYKELLFGSFWKQTQQAAAAADAGLECALYWQFHSGTPACFGLPVPGGWTWGTVGGFSINIPGTCVDVTITTTGTATTTQARGYNTCDTTNPRRVERGLQFTWGQ